MDVSAENGDFSGQNQGNEMRDPHRIMGGNVNGRRVWIPRSRGNPNPNSNPGPNLDADTNARKNPSLNPSLTTDPNPNSVADAHRTLISNQNSKLNWHHINSNRNSSNSNRNFSNSNRNSSNGNDDVRARKSGHQGHVRYRQVSVSSEVEEGIGQTATQLSGIQIDVGVNAESSKSNGLQQDDDGTMGSGALLNRENHHQRSTRGVRGRRHVDRNNNRRIEVFTSQQDGAIDDIVGVGNFERIHNERDNEVSDLEQSFINEDVIATFNSRRHPPQCKREKDPGVMNSEKDTNNYNDRDDMASSSGQNSSSNEGLIGLPNDRRHPPQRWRRNANSFAAGNVDRNAINYDHRDKKASNRGQSLTNEDSILSSNLRKYPQHIFQNQKLDAKEIRYRSTKSIQDWRCRARSSQTHAEPSLKQEIEEDVQESEEDMHLEKSNVPQLVQEIEQKLHKGKVECMICYDMVGRSAAMWSCDSCYAIFHLHCIKKWAKAPTSIDLSAGQGQSSNWRCPGCQSVQYSRPEDIQNYCFCGKMHDPPTDFYLTPHSCGEPCAKPLNKGKNVSHCPHTCTLQCHPGPCPSCTAMAPSQPCPCGKTTITRRCSDQKSVESCGQECGKPLRCGRHFCDKFCHEGPCDLCKVLINASCFCGKKEKTLLCGDIEVQGELEWKNGVYACENLCMKMLSCQNHKCSLGCHPGECGECDLLPQKVKTCPCGKTLLLGQRKSCLDPVPTCSQVCEKFLPCGKHTCRNTCHEGACPPCLVSVDQKCRCGSSSRTAPCWKTTALTENNEEFLCQKVCGQKKSCGRHRCSDKCCPLASRGRSNIHLGDWDTHLCQMACGKKLRCGQHFCQELCHSGHCPPCLETIFSDLSCACGKTSVPPPVPCGTPIPSCTYPCSLPQPCGHLATHTCHSGECPPCTVPIEKKCVGDHVILRNLPCGSRDIRCNKLCGKTRQCGMHACARPCHLPPCDSVSMENSSSAARISCGQTCGAQRRDCKHTCTALCHPSSQCPDARCIFPVTITCSCGRLTAEVPCDAGGNHVRDDPVFEASVLHKLPAPLQPVESHSIRVPLGQRKLACDEECSKLERKKVLADAFDISTTVDLPGVNGAMAEMLADLIRREPQWVSAVEERFKYLVLGRTKANTNIVHVHVFNSMLKEKRDILRHLADRWSVSVYSAGWEPRRFLIVQATQKSRAPGRNLLLKGLHQTTGQVQPPAFNALVDMDPRLVLALFDLPREADVSSLILRFGGECELVWLNDKNALAIFTDPARAATALRRVDHASTYQGAVFIPQTVGLPSRTAWGTKGGAIVEKPNALKKKATESVWMEDSWGEDWSSAQVSNSAWQLNNNPVTTTRNPWLALEKEGEGVTNSSSSHVQLSLKPPISGSSSTIFSSQDNQNKQDFTDEVDDWEKAFE